MATGVATSLGLDHSLEADQNGLASFSPKYSKSKDVIASSALNGPEWADPDLSEEWVSQPNSPVDDPAKSDTLDSKATAASSDAGIGTTRIVASPDKNIDAATGVRHGTPGWKKIDPSKDIFSPLTLERMFKLGTEDTSNAKIQHSRDVHSHLKSSLSKLKYQLDKFSPILGPNPSIYQSEQAQSQASNDSHQKGTLRKPSTYSTIDEEASDREYDYDTTGSPHPPRQKHFTFTKEPKLQKEESQRQPSSPGKSSPLRLFQKHDTYTSSKFDGLIPTLGEDAVQALEAAGDRSVSLEPASFDNNNNNESEITTASLSSPQKERIAKRPRLEQAEPKIPVTVTTQDFLSQAEHVMDMLRGLKKQSDSLATEDGDPLQRLSVMTASQTNTALSKSMSRNNSLRGGALSSVESARSSVDSEANQGTFRRNFYYRNENKRFDEDEFNEHSDSYYNSVKGVYEKGSIQLGIGHVSGTRGKRSLTEIGINHLSPAPSSARQTVQKSPVKNNNFRAPSSPELLTRRDRTPISSTNSSGKAGVDPFRQVTMTSNGSSKKSSATSSVNDNMTVILPEQVKNLIPSTFGSMVFDRQHHRWVRHAKSQVIGEPDEDDVFEGIDDLSDEEKEKSLVLQQQQPQQHEILIGDYQNSLRQSLSSLENTLSGKSASSVVSDFPPPKKESYYQHRIEQHDLFADPVKHVPNYSPRSKPPNNSGKPEVSFAFPPIEHSPNAMDVSYVEGRHDATAVSQLDSSFSIAIQNLVRVLSDIQPFEPYWEDITTLNLPSRNLETLVRLEEWCPNVHNMNVSDNHLGYLTGVPTTIRNLNTSKNNLSDLTAFGFLSNLQYLNLSHNQLETLNGLSNLYHLRELIVDNNEITNINGILHLEGLLRLDLRNNNLKQVNFENARLTRLEELDLSCNNIRHLTGIETLTRLMNLMVDQNSLSKLKSKGLLPRLRTLKASQNDIEIFDVSAFPYLRLLYLDNNKLLKVSGLKKLRLLENLSIRDQRINSREPQCPGVSEVKKLYLSGNLPSDFIFNQYFLNLQILELASVQLAQLPVNFAKFANNLRELNLSFNELSDISELKHIPKLRKLYLIGNQIDDMQHLSSVLQKLPSLQVLDMRMNPMTLHFYPPVVAIESENSNSPKHLHRQYTLVMSRQAQASWEKKDKLFESHLPQISLVKRQAYQGLMFVSSSSLIWLDGSTHDKDSVTELTQVLENIAISTEKKLKNKPRLKKR
ncbi:hypothetical protein V1514DRAFT_328729 [Lipomyces japonicus]|uniref:uncharacterized protein n=1 Tax=Lipomyces japonicus TaxID=56871 RepID=UPI0034CDA97D